LNRAKKPELVFEKAYKQADNKQIFRSESHNIYEIVYEEGKERYCINEFDVRNERQSKNFKTIGFMYTEDFPEFICKDDQEMSSAESPPHCSMRLVDFVLDKDNQYGIFISADYEIVYFQFDMLEDRKDRVGKSNGKTSISFQPWGI